MVDSYNRVNTSKNRSVTYFFALLYLYLVVCLSTSTIGTSGGGLLNQLSAALVIVYCSFKVFFSRKVVPSNGRSLYRLLFLFYIYIIARVLWMLVVDVGGAVMSLRYSFTILFWVVSLLFCFQEFAKTDSRVVSKLSTILIVIAFIVFFNSIIIEQRYWQLNDTIGAVNAAGSAYMLVPLIIIVLKRKARFVGFLLCLVVCAWSQKRQCLLGFALVSLFLLWDLFKAYFKSFKFFAVIILLITIVFSGFIVDKVFSGIIERQLYLTERDDADSGRLTIWEMAIDGYSDAPVMDQLFGGGPGAGARYVESISRGWFVMPHNGFIEVLCDYGVFGVLLYVLFFLSLIRTTFTYPPGSSIRKILLGISLSWIMSNVVSHAGRVWAVFFCIALGYMLCFKNSDNTKSLFYN